MVGSGTWVKLLNFMPRVFAPWGGWGVGHTCVPFFTLWLSKQAGTARSLEAV